MVHAACLLDQFTRVVRFRVRNLSAEEHLLLSRLHVVENLVLRQRLDSEGTAQSIRWYNLRETLDGAVPKYITSDCEFAPRHRADTSLGRLLECFTHWTYEYHGRQALLCGFRGVEWAITDVTIMDNTRDWFLQNPYTGGLQLFASTHVCGPMCGVIGLTQQPPYYPVGPPPIQPEN
ncbi:uncharacterized protein MELLADRAFT_87963 [Melampsora larici-populina 98AG31]|uniref:Alpha-type protein kinase domain-containing protein n=1 Tax=Melampsora larici-populina (strain 98AG31 / pathotype 3-4-7) TaxID=747676 RepID=F4RQJ7_MELLP|nr:uncharacterized protein MELLADRAFT_87963 [Melampsora larici-populina 98AG31]EGG05502.1 hypothetical protein MELLADRAFT_87963 [Melampsora larici-populina 98AG31]